MNQPRLPKRNISGILLLDKIIGVSSNHALQRVKRIYQAEKAGHTGNLDPLATGLLPICLGEATKFSQFLLDADKRYLVTGKLGEQTNTADAEGEVITRCEVDVSEKQLRAAIANYIGKYWQIPPMYSAIKKDGKPLYVLARQGIEIERDAREIEIFSAELLSFDGTFFTLDVHCSKGTYIRSLIEDIAESCCNVAHVTMLRRTEAGIFRAAQMHLSDAVLELKEREGLAAIDALLLPINAMLSHLPMVKFPAHSARFLRMGNAVMQPGVPSTGLMQLFDENEVFLGVGEMDDEGRVQPRRLVQQFVSESD